MEFIETTISFCYVDLSIKKKTTIDSLLVCSHSLDFKEYFPMWTGNL